MKKTICIFGCMIALMLAGCQAQHDPSMDTGQISPSGSSNLGVPSAGNPMNTETGADQTDTKDNPNGDTPPEDDSTDTNTVSDQTDGKDNPNADTPSEGDPVNTDAGSNQTDSKDNPGTDAPSEDDPANTPTQSAPISGDIRDTSSIENASSGAAGAATLDEQAGERELKNEGSLRGEIEVTHKLPIGKRGFSEGDTVVFHVEAKSAGAELKITLTGTGTGTILEGSVTGSGDISFEIDTADEYTAVLENCSLRGVQFTINYSVGGST